MIRETRTRELSVGGNPCRALDLPAIFGADLARLPYQLRILLWNALWHSPTDRHDEICGWFHDWLRGGKALPDLKFRAGRVLMHDTTCIPALVDIAAMRDAIAARGQDPGVLSPKLPVAVSVDHSTPVEFFASGDAMEKNLAVDLARNAERYGMMKWAENSLDNFTLFAPGSGIMHTINLEQLATVVTEADGWLMPDTLIGTDSHTPMVNGIGVFGWGVGGLEAEAVMFGLPITLCFPEVVGVRLEGRLREGSLSTDLVLSLTAILRKENVTGMMVEFFGRGVATLTAGQRATIANMAAEFGGTTAYFPIDEETLKYLRQTGRSARAIERVRVGAHAMGLWFEPAGEPKFSKTICFDLSEVEPSLAGPQRPHDRVASNDVAPSLVRLFGRPLGGTRESIPDGAVAIAAITSCTNTSDPALLVAAGLLAKKANRLGLRPPAWVKTSLAPGSPSASTYLQRAGVLRDMEELGFGIVGYGCTTCIGNSGALLPEMSAHLRDGGIAACVLSGNRNFPGRVHPELSAGFLCSPPMVIAFALAGDLNRDIRRDLIGTRRDGAEIRLVDIWPSAAEVEAACDAALHSGDCIRAFREAQTNAAWQNIEAMDRPQYPWDPTSTYLQPPLFARNPSASRLGRYRATPLIVLGDDVTTDHISPAGRIGVDQPAGRFLQSQGEKAADFNVYASRRGNWQVMVLGLFGSAAVANLLGPEIPPGCTLMPGGGAAVALPEAAERYRTAGRPVVVVGGYRFGQGSSRDWAAKGIALLGTRAVLACSFESIHRSNLIGMGVLPIELPESAHPEILKISPEDEFAIDVDQANLRPSMCAFVSLHSNGVPVRCFECRVAVQTDHEVEILKRGGTLRLIMDAAAAR